MAKYRIHIRRSAVKDLEALPEKDRRRVVSSIRRLGNAVRPPHAEKLSPLDKYRMRVGFCRVAYRIDDEDLSVSIFKVGQRRDVLGRKPFRR